MTTETDNQDIPTETPAENAAEAAAENAAAAQAVDAENVEVGSPEFQQMSADSQAAGSPADLNRFQDIKVSVSADLGRAEVPIQTLMSLGEGSVLELNREIDSPIELVAQGVPLACGEVVVVNGCFAIRVTKVYEAAKG